MFGSTMLDVFIALIFVFTLVSMIASAIQELFARSIALRSRNLKDGVQHLLQDDVNLLEALYDHPLIRALGSKKYNVGSGKGYPEYIPSHTFALALLDLVAHGQGRFRAWEEVKKKAANIKDQNYKTKVLKLLDTGAIVQSISDAVDKLSDPITFSSVPEEFLLRKFPFSLESESKREKITGVLNLTDRKKITKERLRELLPPATQDDTAVNSWIRQNLDERFRRLVVLINSSGNQVADILSNINRLDLAYVAETIEADDVTNYPPSVMLDRNNLLTFIKKIREELSEGPSAPSSVVHFREALRENCSLSVSVRQALTALLDAPGQTMTQQARELVDQLPVSTAKVELKDFLDSSSANVDMYVQNVETWFDDVMEQVSGWYKRKAQVFLLIIGLVISVIGNIDTLTLFSTFYRDVTLRAVIVQAANTFVQAPSPNQSTVSPGEQIPKLQQQLQALALPVGWTQQPRPQPWDEIDEKNSFLSILLRVVGWLLTALAVTLGAPFWFDLLNKLVNLRAASKPASTDSNKDEMLVKI